MNDSNAPLLRITLLQTDIVWEAKQENLRRLDQQLSTLEGSTDLVILPETCTTGFSMNAASLAEEATGATISTLQQLAIKYGMALAGSFIALDAAGAGNTSSYYYNRAFFVTPEGREHFYDKRHLFRMGMEAEHFTPGNHRPVIHYRGWNILLLVCYDLRFPVWSRNTDNEYDLLIYVANWPASRRRVWDLLLPARAVENQCYVCGVNRTGTDGNGLEHNGGSVVYSPKGVRLAAVPDGGEGSCTTTLSLPDLQHFRDKFPVWRDADRFTIFNDTEENTPPKEKQHS